MPWVGLQSVIVVFPDQTHLLFLLAFHPKNVSESNEQYLGFRLATSLISYPFFIIDDFINNNNFFNLPLFSMIAIFVIRCGCQREKEMRLAI